uniref:Vacuolar ATPase assembly integral membrane protein VMA21 n=1 Tax=Denticeps clupeoides TaxID=299321 RepID=A0AAY4ER70_9TELE
MTRRNAGHMIDTRKSSFLSGFSRILLFFTLLMVTLPIGLYFASKSYFEGSLCGPDFTSFFMSNTDSYFYAAIVAVLAVHVVLALFVYVAWNEGSPPKSKGKHD